jgi:HAD superfamily hydrolase (TIGR01490 family)
LVAREGHELGPATYDAHVTRPTAAFFDLDKTIIAKSSTLAFSKPFQAGGLISRRAMLRSTYAQFVYLVGGADHDQMEKMRAFMSALCAGWDVATVREIVADTLHNIVDPIVYDEAVSLIEEHHRAGRDVVIVSTSGSEVVEPIGEMLGADRVVATSMVVEDGHYTGEIEYYAYGETKATAIRALAEEAGYDLEGSYAYSDSATDLPMLEAVGHPVAVNPDRELARVAREREWPVVRFNRPIAMRRRLPSVPELPHLSELDARQRALVGSALVTIAAAAVLLLLASRRRTGRSQSG